MKNIDPTSHQNTYSTSVIDIIEKSLRELNFDVDSCRQEHNVWELLHESATIEIVFHRKKGVIYGDAILAELPNSDRTKVYEYLLKQNFYTKDLSLSIRDNNVLISFMTTDQNLSVDYLKKIISKLLLDANRYDNILVEQFGARWLKS